MSSKSFMTPEEQALKYSRDLKNVIDTAREDGYKEGVEIARREMTVIKLRKANTDIQTISQEIGLSIEEVKEILDGLDR
jgi:hypothetical protein